MSQEQYDSILEWVIRDGRQEFNRQRKEIADLIEGLIAQVKLQNDQQEAHERTYNAAKATYNELAKLRSEVEAEVAPLKGQATYDELAKLRSEVEVEVAALKGQAEGQGAAVTTLTENITRVLKLQWEALTSKLLDDTQSIINAARTKLQDWTQRAIKQEHDNCVESCEINKDATETLPNKV